MGTPETTNYMILGFGLCFTVILLHLGSLSVRNRSLQRDLVMLQKYDKPAKKKKAAPKKKSSKRK
jgi:hypothetical protein